METLITRIRDAEGKGYDVIYYQDLIIAAVFKTVDGVERKLAAIKRIEYQAGDVFLCGYPKCGNHWMSNLITYMQHPGPINGTLSINIPLVDIFSIHEFKNRPCPRLFTTHFKFDRLPVQHVEKNGKVILLLRNPKDVAVSYFYHLKHYTINSDQSWKHYIKCFLEGKVLYGSYFDYLNSWTEILKSRHYQNILVVYYEDLIQDCFRQLKRIQTFLSLSNSDARLQDICNRCSIDQLRSDVNRGDLKTILTNKQGQSQIYRKGQVGDWRNHLTVSQNTDFDEQLKLKLNDTPFQFKYESDSVVSKL